MWASTTKPDTNSVMDQCHHELIQECRHAAPGARLSFTLRTRLEKLSREQRREIANRQHEGSAALFIACKRGNIEIVHYLITVCDADIEQRGAYEVPDDHSIHNVTPLWCAAVAGKLDVVQALVQYGADINAMSDTGSTPVRSACFMTHFEIVQFLVEHGADIQRANYNGGTCLINSVQSVPLCEYLLKKGADVNAQDIQLKTALHYAIQEHRFETAILLLKYGADPFIKNRYGDDALQTACLKGASQVFKHLIENVPYSMERIAEGYELLGSTYLDEHFDLVLTGEYWRKALEIRQAHSIPKRLPPPNPAYLNVAEFTTLEELNAVMNDLDGMRMQSLFISERILGRQHKEMIYRLMYRGAAYADSLQYQRCVDLWKYSFVLRIRKDTLLHNEAAFTAHALVRLFLDLNERTADGHIRDKLQYNDIYETIELILNELPQCVQLLTVRPVFKKQNENFDKILKILTHLLFILKSNSVTKELYEKTLKLTRRIRRINPLNSNRDTLLHLVLSKTNMMKTHMTPHDDITSVFPNYDICKLLVDAGFDVCAQNQSLETPLHVVSGHRNFNLRIVELLLENGAHIDQRDLTGNLPCKRLSTISNCRINPLNYTTLKCLAARKIMAFEIPFSNLVPTQLEDFIRMH